MKKIINKILSINNNRNKPIMIAGHGRSGTTWIGSVFAQAPKVIYYNEPCNPIYNNKGDYSIWFKYLRANDYFKYYESCLDPAFEGNISSFGDVWIRKNPFRRLSKDFRVVIKDVASYISLEWIYHRYHPYILIILRHPCAVALSEINNRTPIHNAINELIKQNSLVNDHLAPYLEIMKKAKKPFEIYATIWAARNRVIANLIREYKEWNLVFYEDFCEKPQNRFYKTFEEINLKWTNNVEKYIMKTTRYIKKGTYTTYRVSQDQIHKWKRNMDQSQINQVIEFVEPFNLPFYNDFSEWISID